MKKKLLILLCSLLLSVSLVGCGDPESVSNPTIKYGSRFLDINTGKYTCIIIDKETKVQYLYAGYGSAGGLTILVDAEGKPILYEGNLEVE